MNYYVIYDPSTGVIRQIQDSFPQLPPPLSHLEILPIDHEIDPNAWCVQDGELQARDPDSDLPYAFLRHRTYGDIGEQLGRLWHDIDAGLLGAAAKTGEFYLEIQRVKQQIPKE